MKAIRTTKSVFTAVSILIIGLLCATIGMAAQVQAQTADVRQFSGQPLQEVLKGYSGRGIKLLYSSNYVLPGMLVRNEPESEQPLQQIMEMLQPFGLKLKQAGTSYLVVQSTTEKRSGSMPSVVIMVRNPETIANLEALKFSAKPAIKHLETYGEGLYEYFPEQTGVYTVVTELPGYLPVQSEILYAGLATSLLIIDLKAAPKGIEEISVSASRYVLFSGSDYVIDQKSIAVSPLLARDPVRAAQRLQGTAADGLSAKTYYRGGAENESSIYLNGLKLLDPFHIRDYHSIFSSIGAQVVSSIQVYTGGFPVEYGDDMSGVMLLQSKSPDEPMHTELGLSLFYASLLNSGHSENRKYDWLVSARRSNLQYVLNPEYGQPDYFDVFTTLGFNFGESSRLTLNVLYTDDEVILVTESDPAEFEQSKSDSINKTIWLTLENDVRDGLTASTTLAFTEFSNNRLASVSDPNELISRVTDFRNVNKLNLSHSMIFASQFGHTFKWGLEFSKLKARYRYAGSAEHFGFWEGFSQVQNPSAYTINASPRGNSYAAFLSDRFLLAADLSLELGLRWDKQTYTETSDSSQVSPRLSVLYNLEQNGELRLTAGRFYQAQQIQDMQVEDNIDHFFPAQYADQLIASYQWKAFDGYAFRAEAYYKRYSQLAPRFENLFDRLQMTPEFQPDRVMLNPDSASAKGLELSVEYATGKSFSWWASYTWAKVSDSIGGIDQRRSWDQPHALQAGLAWQKGDWDIGVAARLHSGWPTTRLEIALDPVSGDPKPLAGPRNAKRFEAFASLDFRVSRQFDTGWGDLTGFIEATNATNRNNPCCLNYGYEIDANGQTVFRSKTEFWLPIVPSIGFSWQF